jgi:hypothetical protein
VSVRTQQTRGMLALNTCGTTYSILYAMLVLEIRGRRLQGVHAPEPEPCLPVLYASAYQRDTPWAGQSPRPHPRIRVVPDLSGGEPDMSLASYHTPSRGGPADTADLVVEARRQKHALISWSWDCRSTRWRTWPIAGSGPSSRTGWDVGVGRAAVQ